MYYATFLNDKLLSLDLKKSSLPLLLYEYKFLFAAIIIAENDNKRGKRLWFWFAAIIIAVKDGNRSKKLKIVASEQS